LLPIALRVVRIPRDCLWPRRVLQLLDFMPRRNEHETVAQALTRHGMNRRAIRRQALEVLTGLPCHCADSDEARRCWIDTARRVCASFALSQPEGQTVGSFFRTPPNRAWARALAARDNTGIRSSTVHEAKGKQFDAVILVLPPDRTPANRTGELLGFWESGAPHEPKHVVYVAVTRARHLAVIACPSAAAARLQSILQRAAVPFQVLPTVG